MSRPPESPEDGAVTPSKIEKAVGPTIVLPSE